jgi:uncharacterized protein
LRQEISSNSVLPSIRDEITLITEDGLLLVGELARPAEKPSRAVLLTLHPLPTHGGFMDSHILRKAANRLPELADISVLRFNTRGTSSPRGTSQGFFGEGLTERHDLDAALAFLSTKNLGPIWLVGWSFGTELAIKYGHDKDIAGAILLSPPLHRAGNEDLLKWVNSGKALIAVVPEHDDFLKPNEAVERFSIVPEAQVIGIDGAKHLWVGESATKTVLNEIVKIVAADKYPLPISY